MWMAAFLHLLRVLFPTVLQQGPKTQLWHDYNWKKTGTDATPWCERRANPQILIRAALLDKNLYCALLLVCPPEALVLGLLGLEMSTYMRAYPTWIEYFLKVDEPAAFPEMSIFLLPQIGWRGIHNCENTFKTRIFVPTRKGIYPAVCMFEATSLFW